MLGFLAPTKVGERWLGEAETERGTGAILSVSQLQEIAFNRWRQPPLRPLRGHLSPTFVGARNQGGA
ncbi:Putative uncharacterized protein [Mesorhizobium loti]|nr:Putative uncharacterized protein [Mesorhizobium loti]